MRKALLFLKGRRSLGLWFYSKDKILFEGEVEFDPKTLELGRLRAKKLPDPAPPKEVLRLLRSAQVSISLDPRTRAVAEGLKASLAVKDVEAETLDLCPPCLYSGSIRPMGEAYLLHGQRVCRDCARRVLRGCAGRDGAGRVGAGCLWPEDPGPARAVCHAGSAQATRAI